MPVPGMDDLLIELAMLVVKGDAFAFGDSGLM